MYLHITAIAKKVTKKKAAKKRADHYEPKVKTDLSFDQLIARSVNKYAEKNPMAKNRKLIFGVFAALSASLCCITPALAFLGGIGGLATSLAWIEPYRPYFISATIFIFAFAWYQKIKAQKQNDCDCEGEETTSFWKTKKFLAIITLLSALLIAFPYYAKIFYPAPKQMAILPTGKMDIHTVAIK
ncbi:MAG: mercuric transporter MerT family protein [Flavisolibacter sp.]